MTGLPREMKLAVVQRRDTLHTLELRDQHIDTGTRRGRGRWPAWAPGGALLYSRFESPAGSSPPKVVAATSADEERILYQPATGDPQAIAPRVPHYYLASNGDAVAVVAARAGGLALFLASLRDPGSARSQLAGAPLFPAWSPDARYLAVHAGTDLVVLDTLSDGRVQPLSGNAAGFRSPAYCSDGSLLAYASSSGADVTVTFADPDGHALERGPGFRRGLAFAFRPGTSELTIATTPDPTSGTYDALWKAEAGSEPRRLYHGSFTAFTWAPGGDRVCLFYPTQSGDGTVGLYILDPDGSVIAASEPFLPSTDQRTWLNFFDQYDKSHSPWLAGGEALLVSGRAGTDRFAPSFGDARGNAIYLWDGQRRSELHDIGPGQFAVPA